MPSNQGGTYDFYKRTKGFKRRRHIKKPIARYVRDEEEIQDPKRFICFSKPFIPYILLNVILSAGVSAISCACFFAFIASSLKVKENAPSSHAISHCYDVSTVTTENSMIIEEFDESSNLR